MIERPITLKASEIQAILAGIQYQIRRPAYPLEAELSDANEPESVCPWGGPGDRLWVQEAFQVWRPSGSDGDEWIGDEAEVIDGPLSESGPGWSGWINVSYQLDDPKLFDEWRLAREMPRWASRIQLEIVRVRVERLQEISRDDAMAMGVELVNPYKIAPDLPPGMPAAFRDYSNPDNFFTADPIASLRSWWNQAWPAFSWADNPWVWAISFKIIERSKA